MRRYDVAIIGAGIGGLVSGALLSQSGRSVAVFEKGGCPGGLCSSFKNGGYVFDAAIDSIGGLVDGEFLRVLFEKLGVLDELDLIPLDPVRRLFLPDFCVDIQPDIKLHKEHLEILFPCEKDNIEKIFTVMEAVYTQSMSLPFGRKEEISSDFMNWLGMSFSDILDKYINDHKLKAVLSSYSTFLGLPANRVSAIFIANTLMHYVKGGAYRVKGGMRHLSEALVNVIKKNGGDVFLNEEVKKLTVEHARAAGIITSKERDIPATHVIVASDLKTMVNHLAPKRSIDEAVSSHVNKMKESSSFIIAYIGTDLDINKLELVSSMGFFSSYDIESMLNMNSDISYGVSIPSMIDDSVAPEGCHNIVFHYPTCKKTVLNKEKIVDKIINSVEKIIPGLSQHIRLLRVADASTIHRYTGNSFGAAYGWEQKIGLYSDMQFLKKIMKNLHVAGHWAGLGGGVMPAAISAVKVAESIIGKKLFNGE